MPLEELSEEEKHQSPQIEQRGGDHIIQVGRVDGDVKFHLLSLKTTLMIIIFAIIAGVVSFYVYPRVQRFRQRFKKMGGEYNFVIAQFHQTNKLPYDVGQLLYKRLLINKGRIAEQLKIDHQLIDIRSPRIMGTIKGKPKDTQEEKARTWAEKIGADVIIYGTIQSEGSTVSIAPEFFGNCRFTLEDYSFHAKELSDESRMGTPIKVDEYPIETLSARSIAFILITYGLQKYASHNYEEALRLFKAADSINGWNEGKDVLYGIMGYSALRQNLLSKAERYCQGSLNILYPQKSQYSRAYLCLGFVRYEQAFEDETINTIRLDQAIALLHDAINAEEHPPEAYVWDKARLTLGKAYIAKVVATKNEDEYCDNFSSASAELNAVTTKYENTKEVRLKEVASLAYERLGVINRYCDDIPLAIDSYQKAIDLSEHIEQKAPYEEELGELFASIGSEEKAKYRYNNALQKYQELIKNESKGSPKNIQYTDKIFEIRSKMLDFRQNNTSLTPSNFAPPNQNEQN